MKSPRSSGKPKRPKNPLLVRQIQGHSMLPVLPPGTVVFGVRWFRTLKPGDIIVFFHNDKEKIKRVDRIDADRLYVLGDHADTSTDSRHFGWIKRHTVIAKIIWPHAPKYRAEGVDRPIDGQN